MTAKNKLPTFCGGIGQQYSEELGFEYRQYDFMYVLGEMLTNPADVVKDNAQWAIFSTLPSRSRQLQQDKGNFLALWADIDEGNPSLDEVKSAIGSIVGNVMLGIYSTKSYNETEGKRKWRIIIPVSFLDDSKAIKGDSYALAQTTLNNLLAKHGLIPDRVTERENQLCYLPNRGEEYHHAFNQVMNFFNYNQCPEFLDEMIAVKNAQIAEEAALKVKLEEGRKRAAARVASGECSVIDAVNSSYDLPSMLLNYGYKLKGGRYLSPLSSSGVAGVSIDTSGVVPKWVSRHGSDKDFFGRGTGDIFDLICAFDYGNNRNKAIQELGDEIKTADGRSLTQVNQDNFRQQNSFGDQYSELGKGESQWSMPGLDSVSHTSQPSTSASHTSSEQQGNQSKPLPDWVKEEIESSPSLEEDESVKPDSGSKSSQVELSTSDARNGLQSGKKSSLEGYQQDTSNPWSLSPEKLAEIHAISDSRKSPEEALEQTRASNGTSRSLVRDDANSLDDINPRDFFNIIEGSEIGSTAKPAEWLIGGMLESDSIGILAGATGSYKTFIALRLAYSVAMGEDFFRFPSAKVGKVLYLTGEGGNGIRKRVLALEKLHGKVFENLLVPDMHVDLTDPDVIMMLDRLIKQEMPVLIIYDTLNSLSSLDNNSSKEVSAMMKDIRKLGKAAKASSMIVHHFGKDAKKGMEGSHAFESNADFVFSTDKSGWKPKDTGDKTQQERLGTNLECIKQKDAEKFKAMTLMLDVVPLGMKETYANIEVTSLALSGGHESDFGDMPSGAHDNKQTAIDEVVTKVKAMYRKDAPVSISRLEDAGMRVEHVIKAAKTGAIKEVAGMYYPKDSDCNEFAVKQAKAQQVMFENDKQGMPNYKNTANDIPEASDADYKKHSAVQKPSDTEAPNW